MIITKQEIDININIPKEIFRKELSIILIKIDSIIKKNKKILMKDILIKLTDYELFIVIAKLIMEFRTYKDSLIGSLYHLKNKEEAIKLFSTNTEDSLFFITNK
jgi:hypothetical protein